MKKFITIIFMSLSFIMHAMASDTVNKEPSPRGEWEFINKWMLIEYAAQGNLEGVKELIEKENVDPNYKPEDGEYIGMTALTSALENKHYDIAKYLVKKGADVNLNAYEVYSSDYPLDISLRNNNYELAKYLIKHGAYVGTEDTSGRNILFGIDTDTEEGFQFFKYLVEEHKQNINVTDKYGWGLVRRINNLKTLNYLLSNGVDVNSFTPVSPPPLWDGYTALMANASDTQNLGVIAFLIHKGADVNYQSSIIENKGGETALMIAAQSCSFENIDYLLLKGAKKELKNHNGDIALNYAQSSQCSEEILTLLR